jgi:hypothetical protein
LRRLGRNVARHAMIRLRHLAEILIDQAERVFRIEVADDHDGGVLGNVIRLEEVPHVVNRRRLEIFHAADGWMLVRVYGERLVVDDFVQAAVRLVLDPHPAFFFDDFALGLERPIVDLQ